MYKFIITQIGTACLSFCGVSNCALITAKKTEALFLSRHHARLFLSKVRPDEENRKGGNYRGNGSRAVYQAGQPIH